MKLTKHFLVFLLFFSIFSCKLYSQTVRIENVQYYIDYSVNAIIITYDFKDHSEFETYEIKLTFKDGNNLIIRPLSVTGNVGKEVAGGEQKKIHWEILNDIENLPETARTIITITSVNNITVDPSVALIMNQINISNKSKYNFKFKRDGMMAIGVGTGISAVVFKVKADNYIDEQSMAENIDEYNIAGENADSFYTMSKIAGAISLVSVSYALYQYIWADKPQRRNNNIVISPTKSNGVLIAWTRNF
jgi:hypothetical protein